MSTKINHYNKIKKNNVILVCIVMSLLFCIFGVRNLMNWVTKMSGRNYEVLVYGE